MVTIELEEREVRDLLKALSVYRRQWLDKQALIERRIKLIDTHTSRGKRDFEDMSIDKQIARHYIRYLDTLSDRLIESIR